MRIVKDLMVPVEDCGTVNQEISLCEAIRTLKRTQGTLLVLDKDHRVVGKLGHTEIVTSIYPTHRHQDGSEAIAHTSLAGLSPALLNSLMERYSNWNESQEQICQRLLNLKVKECIRTPSSDEGVLESDLLEVAIHKMVKGRHQSILVTGAKGIVGILTLADVLEQIARGCGEWDE